MTEVFRDRVDKDMFDKAVEQALVDGINLYREKAENRDFDWSMSDKMAFKPHSFVTFIYMKACRLVQVARKYLGQPGRMNDWSLGAELQEEARDIMVYCAGLLAYLSYCGSAYDAEQKQGDPDVN